MKKGLWLVPFLLISMVMTACGSEDASSSEGNTVTVEASNWEFDKQEYKVPAGDVTINLKNADGYHGITIEGTDVKIDGEGKATVNLKAGEYTIKCNIPCGEGHQEMTAMLIVE
jgi:cytochrome c oxidase subunit II